MGPGHCPRSCRPGEIVTGRAHAGVLVAAMAFAVPLLAGCLVEPGAAQILVPPLSEGSSATFTISGTPNGVFSAMGRVLRDPEGTPLFPVSDAHLVAEVGRPMTVLSADGDMTGGVLPINYSLVMGESSHHLRTEYMSRHGGQVATQSYVLVGDADGTLQTTPTTTWAGGAPDFFVASWFAGKTLERGAMAMPVYPLPGGWLSRLAEAPVFWDVHVADGKASTILRPETTLRSHSIAHLSMFWDDSCPFPKALDVTASGDGLNFSAERIQCHTSAGTEIDVSSPDARITEPSPFLAPMGHRGPVPVDGPLEFRGFDVVEAYARALKTATVWGHCQTPSDCVVVQLRWSEGTRPAPESIVALNRSYLQWTFEFSSSISGSVAYTVEQSAGPPIVFESSPQITASRLDEIASSETFGLQFRSILPALEILFADVPVMLEWNLATENETEARDWPPRIELLALMEAMYDANEPSTVAGFPMMWHADSGGKLDSYIGFAFS